MIRSRALPAALLVAALLAGACATSSDRSTQLTIRALTGPTTTTEESEIVTPTTVPPCDATASLRPGPLPPPGAMPEGSTMREIFDRGRLIVGVDENTLPLSYRNPITGDLEGFEIDLVRELARAIFGSDAVLPKTVTTDQKVDVVEDGVVDLTASAVSMTCDRWEQVSFSSAYYVAYQRVMVQDDSDITAIDDLDGRSVCVTIGSTSEGVMREAQPGAEIHAVDTRTDCLIDLQDGDVDSIFTHDTFLAGFAEQDPHTRVIPGELSEQFYGIAVAHEHEDLVRFVNGVLERMRADGSLAALATRWLGASLTRPIPDARYRD